ncbi:unnamed protein product [Somion occarium]|uniref:Uncharacterized protein n=1 Tax=Somion occarium TaxID=3059160 RepID=A0ABP1DLW8_9APHY
MSITCPVCKGRSFIDQTAYDGHLGGKKHLQKASALQRASKASTGVTPSTQQLPPSNQSSAGSSSGSQANKSICFKCESTFANEAGMKDHLAAAHGLTFCDNPCRQWIDREQLARHYTLSPNHPKCAKCNKGFRDAGALTSHRSSSHPQVVCTTCNEAVDKDELAEHWKLSSSHPTCVQCDIGFEDMDAYLKHQGVEHIYPCLVCNVGFPTIKARKQHYYDTPASHPRCMECSESVKDEDALRDHIHAVHHLDLCVHCHHYLPTEHVKEAHPEIYCEECDIIFLNEECLSEHYKISGKHGCCVMCDIGFKTEGDQTLHMIFEHEAGPGCKPCHIVFDNVEELHKHYRLTGPPKHPLCPKCGKGFSDEDRLSSHLASDHPKVLCTPCRLYLDVDQLESHFKTSSNHPSCTRCDQGFENRLLFSEHTFGLHPELCCDTCWLAFEESVLLEQHYIESGMHATCPTCMRGFKENVELLDHIQEVHANDKSWEHVNNDEDTSSACDVDEVHDNLDSSGSIVGVLGRNVTTTLMARGSTNISVVSLKPLPSTAGNPDHSDSLKGPASPILSSVTLSTIGQPLVASLPSSEASDIQASVAPTQLANRISVSLNEQLAARGLPEESAESRPARLQSALSSGRTTLAPRPKQSFDCRICKSDPEEPVATMCGHLFCHKCLIQELANHDRCPACDSMILLRLQV